MGIQIGRRLRLAMFTELTRKNGSSRVVCYQFEKYLRQANIDVQFFPPSSISAYELLIERVRQPKWLALVLKAIYWYLLVLPKRLVQIARAMVYDMIFVQRGLLKWNSQPFLEILLWVLARRILKRPFIYALDDAMYLLAPRQYSTRIKLADWVYTGNADIASYARTLMPRLMRQESVVDLDYYRPKLHTEHTPVIIGWAGTLLDDQGGPLRIIAAALPRVSQRCHVVIHVVSNRTWETGGNWLNVVNVRWSMESEVENLEKFDIGIMPLEDDQYNRSKEGYKLKVYMAMGIPVVCSPIGKNRDIVQDGITGYLAANEEEWVDRLTSLVTSVELRAQMGAAGRARVQECYSLSKAGPRFATWLRDLCNSNQVSLTLPKLG